MQFLMLILNLKLIFIVDRKILEQIVEQYKTPTNKNVKTAVLFLFFFLFS